MGFDSASGSGQVGFSSSSTSSRSSGVVGAAPSGCGSGSATYFLAAASSDGGVGKAPRLGVSGVPDSGGSSGVSPDPAVVIMPRASVPLAQPPASGGRCADRYRLASSQWRRDRRGVIPQPADSSGDHDRPRRTGVPSGTRSGALGMDGWFGRGRPFRSAGPDDRDRPRGDGERAGPRVERRGRHHRVCAAPPQRVEPVALPGGLGHGLGGCGGGSMTETAERAAATPPASGLPHWTPPGWVDPTRTPILHERPRRRFSVCSPRLTADG